MEQKHKRHIWAVICGMLAGYLCFSAIFNGADMYYMRQSGSQNHLHIYFWGEHWIVRVIAAVICSVWAGVITGAVSRTNGKTLALLAVLPSIIFWALVFYCSLMGYYFYPFEDTTNISIPNKVIAILIPVLIPIGAWFGGEIGEEFVQDKAGYFDSRPNTLLGIKWYHYIWLPFLLNIIAMLCSFSGIYLLGWVGLYLLTSDLFSLASIFPFFVIYILYISFNYIFEGLKECYWILTDFHPLPRSQAFAGVLKNGVGIPILAFLFQIVVMLAHAGITILWHKIRA